MAKCADFSQPRGFECMDDDCISFTVPLSSWVLNIFTILPVGLPARPPSDESRRRVSTEYKKTPDRTPVPPPHGCLSFQCLLGWPFGSLVPEVQIGGACLGVPVCASAYVHIKHTCRHRTHDRGLFTRSYCSVSLVCPCQTRPRLQGELCKSYTHL